jgi:hypothetical protein
VGRVTEDCKQGAEINTQINDAFSLIKILGFDINNIKIIYNRPAQLKVKFNNFEKPCSNLNELCVVVWAKESYIKMMFKC